MACTKPSLLTQDVAPLSILDAGSQEMLAMLSGPAPLERAPPPAKRSWLGALGALRPDLAAAQPAQKTVGLPASALRSARFVRPLPDQLCRLLDRLSGPIAEQCSQRAVQLPRHVAPVDLPR